MIKVLTTHKVVQGGHIYFSIYNFDFLPVLCILFILSCLVTDHMKY
jgi:hypothetical protein